MLWVGLATLIMLITGTGDDTREFRKRQQAMEMALQEIVSDVQHREAAVSALKETTDAFAAHRSRLHAEGECIRKADANYRATRADYELCLKGLDEVWSRASSEFLKAEKDFRAALSAQEFSRVQKRAIP